jgi:hypothetical protein
LGDGSYGEPGHDDARYDDARYDDPRYDDTADPAATDPTMGPVGADPDARTEPDPADPDPAGPFPPAVDLGALPEPVDGFPWIDTGSLGFLGADTAADTASVAAGGAPVTAEQLSADLTAYAATDLPPGVDPWAELAGSDDPATSALARWWAPRQ